MTTTTESFGYINYLHSREVGADWCVCGGEICSDCLECLDDPTAHCQQCGEHVDGLGECQGDCAGDGQSAVCDSCGKTMRDVARDELETGERPVCAACGLADMEAKHGADWDTSW